jgi:hypothetical protein
MIEGPISALGCQSPTLTQLMSSHAVLDPILVRPASDKKKSPISDCFLKCQEEKNKQKATYSG